jgi:hypothetical protein
MHIRQNSLSLKNKLSCPCFTVPIAIIRQLIIIVWINRLSICRVNKCDFHGNDQYSVKRCKLYLLQTYSYIGFLVDKSLYPKHYLFYFIAFPSHIRNIYIYIYAFHFHMESSYIHKSWPTYNITLDRMVAWVSTVKITNYCGPKTQTDNTIICGGTLKSIESKNNSLGVCQSSCFVEFCCIRTNGNGILDKKLQIPSRVRISIYHV